MLRDVGLLCKMLDCLDSFIVGNPLLTSSTEINKQWVSDDVINLFYTQIK